MAFTEVFKFKALDLASKTMKGIGQSFDRLEAKTKKLNASAAVTRQRFANLNRTLRQSSGMAKNLGRNISTFVTLPVIAAGVAAIKSFTSFEDGLIGVQKTTDLTDSEVQKLGDTFRNISKDLPLSTDKLLQFAQVAGQLGIKGRGNLEKFAVVLSKIEVATDVVGEVGAKQIARILNVTKEGTEVVDRFGAALTFLGNNAATGEAEILDLANRVTGATARFGSGTVEILAMSTAMKELGIASEFGGTAISKTFIQLEKAIADKGSTSFRGLERLTGLVGDDLVKAFSDDANEVFIKFTEALGQLKGKDKTGGEFIKTLDQLGLSGIRAVNTLAKLSGAKDKKTGINLLRLRLGQSATAFKENTALEIEFEKRTRATSAAFVVLMNRIKSFTNVITNSFKPEIDATANIVGKFFTFLENNPGIARFIGGITLAVAALGPLLFISGAAVSSVVAIGAAFSVAAGAALLMGVQVAALVAFLSLLVAFKSDIQKFAEPFIEIASTFGANVLNSALGLGAIESGGGLNKVAGFSVPTIGGGSQARQNVGGAIDVNFKNTPTGTRIQATPLDGTELNVGQSGGLQ